MRKLIRIIDRKVMTNLKNQNEPQKQKSTLSQKACNKKKLTYEEKFISFPYRRNKLKQKITISNFQLNQQSQSKSFLAKSNFDGTEFIAKFKNTDKQNILKDNSDYEESQDNKIQPKIVEEFKATISQINLLLRRLYEHKKLLLENPKFSSNIDFSHMLLIVFFVGLVGYLFFRYYLFDMISSQNYASVSKYQQYVFFGFLSLIICLYFLNFLICVKTPYKYFSFDYEVIKTISKKLMEDNQKIFNSAGYCLECDIEMTWILLRPQKIDK